MVPALERDCAGEREMGVDESEAELGTELDDSSFSRNLTSRVNLADADLALLLFPLLLLLFNILPLAHHSRPTTRSSSQDRSPSSPFKPPLLLPPKTTVLQPQRKQNMTRSKSGCIIKRRVSRSWQGEARGWDAPGPMGLSRTR